MSYNTLLTGTTSKVLAHIVADVWGSVKVSPAGGLRADTNMAAPVTRQLWPPPLFFFFFFAAVSDVSSTSLMFTPAALDNESPQSCCSHHKNTHLPGRATCNTCVTFLVKPVECLSCLPLVYICAVIQCFCWQMAWKLNSFLHIYAI